MVDLGRRRRPERRVARYAWPAAAAAGLAWRGADSLRHRRESGHGYDLRGELDVRSEAFLRAAEALTGAPVSWGDDVELLINGDQIFPCYLRAIRESQATVCLLTYVYWRGEIAHDVADALCERARAGVECNVLIDAVGGMKLEREVLDRMSEAGVRVLVPGAITDKPPVWLAGRAAYDDLLGAGVELYEYQPTMLHAKTLTVDGCWSAVGSANFDNRSFQLNDEATLCVTSAAFAGRLTGQFERDLDVSERIRPGRWRRRGPLQRAGESVTALARREL